MLKQLAEQFPEFPMRVGSVIDSATSEWLGRLSAVIEESADLSDKVALRSAGDWIYTSLHTRSVTQIRNILHRAVAKARMQLPATSEGRVFAAASPFDVLSTLAKVIGAASESVTLVDPYLGPRALSAMAIQAKPRVTIRLLASKGRSGPVITPLVEAWKKQHQPERPIEVRLVGAGILHDRWIFIDGREAWQSSQSFEHLAEKSTAVFQRIESGLESEKIEAYENIWSNAERG